MNKLFFLILGCILLFLPKGHYSQISLFGEYYTINENIKNKLYYHAEKSKSNGFTMEHIGDRVQKILPIIESIITKYGIPNDFKYLAVAESGLSNVQSPVGASGVWQIMPETGRSLGLTINDREDDRNNLILSTHAACRYLLRSYKVLKNWTLVAASYNCGLGCIKKEINENDTKNYFKMKLNKETSDYIYRIISCKILLENSIFVPLKETKKQRINKDTLEAPLQIKLENNIVLKDSIIEKINLHYLYTIKLKSISENGKEFKKEMLFKIQKNEYINTQTYVKSTAIETNDRYYFTINGIDISDEYKNIIIKVIDNDKIEGLNKTDYHRMIDNRILTAKVYEL